jgi:glucosamine--fructose-6-phosphate aminotransferase (isomerizing)
MLSGSPYSLVNEMLEAPGILRRFDRAQVTDWAQAIDAKKRLFLTGEGASRIFPAKNMIDLALQKRTPWHICTEGARQAAEYDLRDFVVIGASNSGRTRELITLFEKLKRDHISSYGITAAAGNPLAAIADHSLQLSCGPEKAIAATKSVVEEALVYQSLLKGEEWKNQSRAADCCEDVLTQPVAPVITDCLKNAPVIYFAGRNNGVAEELTLKTNEIARKRSGYLEGTYVLHGIEEVMQKGEVIVLVEPFKEEIEKYREILEKRAGVTVIAISSFATPFLTVKIPVVEGFNGYIQLMAGWNVLVAAGLASGIDIDKTTRARKVGNEI